MIFVVIVADHTHSSLSGLMMMIVLYVYMLCVLLLTGKVVVYQIRTMKILYAPKCLLLDQVGQT